MKIKKPRLFFLFFIPFISFAQSFNSGIISKHKETKLKPADSFSALKKIGFLKKDSEYSISSLSPSIRLVVSEEFKSFLEEWSIYIEKANYQLSQNFKLDPNFRNNYLIFSSPRRQVQNAFATIYPFHLIKIYPSISSEFMDQWSIFSWSQDSLVHEMAHIYQLSQNSKWDRVLWPLLGLFSYRNFVLPSWILEGSAVLMESMYGSGGRLFSGLARAFVFAQIKEDFSLKRLLKAYDDSFSSLEKYLHGAYFFSYLHSQYGLQQTKKLFDEASRFLPLDYYGLNSSLKRTFGKDLQTLFSAYKNYYRDLAQKQTYSLKPVLAKSKHYVPINSDQNSIYFLISDSKSPAQLIVFDKKTALIKKSEKALPIGKVFYKEGSYYSSGNLKTSGSSIESSLVKEGFKPIKKYNSQYVMDFYKDKAIAIDARQSHKGNSLIIDDAFYSFVNSSVLTDSSGAVYYFKQLGEYRVLYKNKQTLSKFKSYFSYPVEVIGDSVYFIGATKYGSSLFVYKEGQGIYRLSASDRIVSARQIKDNQFLISEISSSHYEYKVIEIKEKREEPFLYKLSFQKENIFFQEKELKPKDIKQPLSLTESQKHLKTNELNTSFKPYNSLSQLSLQKFYFYFAPDYPAFSSEIYQADFSSFFNFSDPLQFNELFVFNELGQNDKFFKFSYSYKKYRMALELSFFYDESYLNLKDSEYLIETFKDIGFLKTRDIFYPVKKDLSLMKKDSLFQRTRALALALNYPFYIDSESSLAFKALLRFGQKEFNKNKKWKSYIEQEGQLKYQFSRKYQKAYSYHKKRSLALKYHFLQLKESSKSHPQFLNGALQAFLMEELGRESFLSLSGTVLLNLWNREPRWPQIKEENAFSCSFQKLYQKGVCPDEFKLSSHNIYQGSIELMKLLNLSYYPLKIPFSIRRLAPLAGVAFLSVQDFNLDSRSFVIPFIGVEGEMIFLHERLIVKLGMAVENRIEFFKPYKSSSFQLSLWLKSDL